MMIGSVSLDQLIDPCASRQRSYLYFFNSLRRRYIASLFLAYNAHGLAERYSAKPAISEGHRFETQGRAISLWSKYELDEADMPSFVGFVKTSSASGDCMGSDLWVATRCLRAVPCCEWQSGVAAA